MSPFDAVRPPRKKNAEAPPEKKESPSFSASAKTKKKETTSPAPKKLKRPMPHRERLVWIISGSITGLILIIWLIFFSTGSITSSSENTGGFWGRIGTTIGNFIETVKVDWLKLQDDLEEDESQQTPDEERIRELEEQVFPQFEDPTKQ